MIGLSGALARLGGLRAALPSAAQRGVRAALDRTLALSRAAAPVDTGRLRDSLRATEDASGGAVGTDCPYAAAVELGARGAPARPFLTPAFRRADFKTECEKALREVVHG